jgi:hypothetical protein
MALELVKTSRNGNALIFNDEHYRFIRKRKLSFYWRCSTTNCPCTAITTEDEGLKLVSSKGVHNHDSQKKKCNTVKMKNRMLEIQNRGEGVKTTYDAVMQEFTTGIAEENLPATVAELPLFHSVRSSIQRTNQRMHPMLPINIAQIDLTYERRLTNGGQRFLLADDRNESGILLFASDADLQWLSRSRIILIDGSFEVAPEFFLQMYTIHGDIFDHEIKPFVYALLPNKTEYTYNRLFHIVQSEMGDRGLVLQPEKIILDFEKAAFNVVIRRFPLTYKAGTILNYLLT